MPAGENATGLPEMRESSSRAGRCGGNQTRSPNFYLELLSWQGIPARAPMVLQVATLELNHHPPPCRAPLSPIIHHGCLRRRFATVPFFPPLIEVAPGVTTVGSWTLCQAHRPALDGALGIDPIRRLVRGRPLWPVAERKRGASPPSRTRATPTKHITPPPQQSAQPATPPWHPTPARRPACRAGTAHRAGTRRGSVSRAGATTQPVSLRRMISASDPPACTCSYGPQASTVASAASSSSSGNFEDSIRRAICTTASMVWLAAPVPCVW